MRLRAVWTSLAVSFLSFAALCSPAQGPKPRLATTLSSAGGLTQLTGTRPGQAAHGTDMGAVPADTPLNGITLVLNRSTAQQADLDTLLYAQSNPASPLYHHWLTPEQFAPRFGVADADLAKIKAWLQGQGFHIFGVSRSHDRITFDGNVGQVNTSFNTELHQYAFPDKVHFAPNSDLSVPTALAPLVTTISRLSNFQPHRQLKLAPHTVAKPAFTQSGTGAHYLTPSDLATMYDLNTVYKAGYNGAGQAIAILGQSYITTDPIIQFAGALGSTSGGPLLTLVPDTGVNAINSQNDGDEGESQLDVEYAGGMAPGAAIYFVYTGDSSTGGIFDSLTYAIDENIAPVISGSYGFCETELQSSPSFATAVSNEIQQANAQGQTVLFSAGDAGSTDCYGDTDFGATQQGNLVADFPATVPYITAVGGTQMAAGTFSNTNTQYWQSASGSDVAGSLLSYVPETVWNEDVALGTVASGGGGSSVLYNRPTWQTGVAGIPAGTTRLVPDIAIQASIESPGYLYCTSDTGDLDAEGATDSCTNGFRGSTGGVLVAGGTSFAAPAVAGMIAVLNQAKHATGQGNLNATLYALATNATTYASAFHDITTGTNACTAGSTICTTAGASAYSATTGYDEASGLGSFDFANLVTAWPSSAASALLPTAIDLDPSSGNNVNVFVNQQGTATGIPTGTVAIMIDGTTINPALSLSNGMATFTYADPDNSTHLVTFTYSGDSTYAPSKTSLEYYAQNTSASGSFTLASQPVAVAYNGVASTSLVLTPASGYTGTVVVSVDYTSSLSLCFGLTNPNSNGVNVPLTTGAPVTATLMVGEGTQCNTATGAMIPRRATRVAKAEPSSRLPSHHAPAGVAFAGLLLSGLALRRSRRLPALLGLAVLATLGVGLSGCGGSSTSTSTPTPVNTTQTVSITLSGVDSVVSGIANSTTFTLTVR